MTSLAASLLPVILDLLYYYSFIITGITYAMGYDLGSHFVLYVFDSVTFLVLVCLGYCK